MVEMYFLLNPKGRLSMGLKRGRFSAQETKFVTDNANSMTVEEMASKLNRGVDSVRKLLPETVGATSGADADQKKNLAP